MAKKQVTKEMILTTALKLLREQGYEAVNIKQLAQALGCSTQPVYLSFSGMDQLRGGTGASGSGGIRDVHERQRQGRYGARV